MSAIPQQPAIRPIALERADVEEIYRGLCQASQDPSLGDQARRGLKAVAKVLARRYQLKQAPRDVSTMSALHAESRVLP